jgi:hypothetical protein
MTETRAQRVLDAVIEARDPRPGRLGRCWL